MERPVRDLLRRQARQSRPQGRPRRPLPQRGRRAHQRERGNLRLPESRLADEARQRAGQIRPRAEHRGTYKHLSNFFDKKGKSLCLHEGSGTTFSHECPGLAM